MLVDVLVEKTLEQALLEAEQEHELEGIQAKNDELTAAKKQRKRRSRPSRRRPWTTRPRSCRTWSTTSSAWLASAIWLAKLVLSSSWPRTSSPSLKLRSSTLRSRGAWPDPVEYEIRKEFLPALVEGVAEQLQGEMLLAQKVLDDVIQGCVDECNYHPELEPPKPPPPPAEEEEEEEPPPEAEGRGRLQADVIIAKHRTT